MLLFCGTSLILAYAAQPKALASTLILNGLAICFSALLAWRDSPMLNGLALFGIAASLAVASGRNFSRTAFAKRISQYFRTFLDTALHAIIGFLLLLENEIQWRKSSETGIWRHLRTALSGILIALPFLVLFAILFSSADAVFRDRLKALLQFDLKNFILNTFWTGMICWMTAGYLRKSLIVPEKPPVLPAERNPWLTSAELNIALGCVNILFLSFVVVQLKYFFGGSSTIKVTADLTYAEYARRGFFELVAASVLVLPLLLLADSLHPEKKSKAGFRALSGMMVGLLLVIMLSAGRRMHLYQTEYGLTELRFYVSAFIMALTVAFFWFCGTVLCGKRPLFAGGLFCIGALSIFALHAVNPDAWIARVNLARQTEGKLFDPHYIATLSADAAPAIMDALPKLSEKERAAVTTRLKLNGSMYDWRSWNWSRFRGSKSIQKTR